MRDEDYIVFFKSGNNRPVDKTDVLFCKDSYFCS